jgi:tetratricopeptide (TPR) repeat protein
MNRYLQPRRSGPPWRALIIGIVLLGIAALMVYNIPWVYDRLAWRVDGFKASIKYAINPPEEAVFLPEQQQAQINAVVSATFAALTPGATGTQPPAAATQPGTPQPTASPTIAPTALPGDVLVSGILHQYQRWNNCGPATLSMALSYYDWNGDQYDAAEFLKPNDRDKNVMPYEMVAFVNENTGYQAVARVGGDLRLIKTLLAGGYPVIVEKGFTGAAFDGWMGHSELVSGYNDAEGVFIAQDSYNGPDFEISYERFNADWQNFNYTFIVIYDPGKEAQVSALLGPWMDEAWAVSHALEIAAAETATLQGRALFFAYFNKGMNHVQRFEYYDAASAFDFAFYLYPQIAEEDRPWRAMWYLTGPYFAYYYTGRYADVISLANNTLAVMSEPVLEESYYWRGLAYQAQGDLSRAENDYRKSISLNENFAPGYAALNALIGGGN